MFYVCEVVDGCAWAQKIRLERIKKANNQHWLIVIFNKNAS